MTDVLHDVKRRHDFVLLFDVQDGNPNGDPDAGNLPRVDPETMHGIVTDVCLKRKVRNFVDALQGQAEKYKIYVQNKEALNSMHLRAYTARKIKPTGSKQKREEVEQVRAWMCENFYDIRTFGAVMTNEVNCGQVRGPMQITFSRSIDPVVPQEIAITRIAITRPDDMNYVAGETPDKDKGGKVTEMGRKSIVPYGLYRAYGFFNAKLAAQTGFGAEDLALFWRALLEMWDMDRSASRGLMAVRGLYVFTHESEYGNVPADQLFDLVTSRIAKTDGVETPRSIHDYTLPTTEELRPLLPQSVTVVNLAARSRGARA